MTCHADVDVRAKHLRWLTHIETLCSVTCTILRRGRRRKKEGALNASVHYEAVNYGDKVCHLILCSFHHNHPQLCSEKSSLEAISPEPQLRTSHKDLPTVCAILAIHYKVSLANILKLEECTVTKMYGRSGCINVHVWVSDHWSRDVPPLPCSCYFLHKNTH